MLTPPTGQLFYSFGPLHKTIMYLNHADSKAYHTPASSLVDSFILYLTYRNFPPWADPPPADAKAMAGKSADNLAVLTNRGYTSSVWGPFDLSAFHGGLNGLVVSLRDSNSSNPETIIMAGHEKRKYQSRQRAIRLSAFVAMALALAGVVVAESLSNQASLADTHSASNLVDSNASTRPALGSGNMIDTFLNLNQERYRETLVRTRAWLDNLEVNPTDLRAHGIKGKKKLAELLDVYLRLSDLATADDKKALQERIRSITAVTTAATAPGTPPTPATVRYHDMLRITDQQFKEDSTSYLRVAFLMDRFGLDTTLYRQEIQKVLPRLNNHMKYRGSDQRMAFHLYYKHFGLEEPFPLQAAYQTGVIASRHDSAWFKQNKMEMYSLTHEIFAPYEFGEKLDADFFSEPDKAYLRPLLADLTAYGIGLDDTDITAELTSCLRYLHFTDMPIYQESLQYLLKSQRPEGKWGNYEQHRGYYGDYVNQAFYLHTTLVVVDALTTAFHYRER